MNHKPLIMKHIFRDKNSFISVVVALILTAPTLCWAVSPLDLTTPEPLLPQIDRPLSPLERGRIKREIEKLNVSATAQLEARNTDAAFELLYRIIRLQKHLGITQEEEIEALALVGQIAWEQNSSSDMEIISNALAQIQKNIENQPELLSDLAKAYQGAGYPDKALKIYQQLLIIFREKEDNSTIELILNKIGELNLILFDYPEAAVAYEELLKRASDQGNYINQGVYLGQLAEIYTEAMEPENAVRIKEQLAQNYLDNQNLKELAALKISLGDDYTILKQPELASKNYQEAFALAWELKYYATASDSLRKLGELYRTYHQNDSAKQVYQELLKVEQVSYNLYGIMNTYDRLGQIYLEEENYSEAKAAFEQGLAIANSLNYQQDYFRQLLQLVEEKMVNG